MNYHDKLKEAFKRLNEEYNTPEKSLYYLVYKLGTNNPDGSLTKEYGGEYTTIPKDDRGVPIQTKIIHINRNIIQQNAKRGESRPVCRVEGVDGKVTYCMEVIINGPSRMVYRPDAPRKCGAKLWIETESDIEMIGAENE